jgi:tRNA(fMet)-specific endonuclease VapC
MVTYLLDTDALSEPARPKPSARFMRKLRAHASDVAIASITWHEAVFGLERMSPGKRRDAVHAYLYDTIASTMTILPYDARAAEIHANERARLTATGRVPTFADGQIAAIATANHLVLVTSNTKHFAIFDALVIESWR